MYLQDAIKYYKTKVEIARALNITRQTVQKWPEIVPIGHAAVLHLLTDGKLQCNLKLYGLK